MSQARRRSSPKPLTVRRLPVRFTSDIRRVITRFFDPGGELRIRNVLQRVAQLSDSEVTRLLDLVFQRFRTRHSNITSVFEQHYRSAMSMIGGADKLTRNRQLLIGSYFTMEYSIESAALFNPSIVQAPEPAKPARGGRALHHEPAGHRRGTCLVDRLSHRRDLLGPRSPDGSPQPVRQSHSRFHRHAIRQAALLPQVTGHRRLTDRDGHRVAASRRLVHDDSIGASDRRGTGGSARNAPSGGHRPKHPLAGAVQLPAGALARGGGLGSGHLSANQQREPRDRRPADGPLRRRRRDGDLLRHVYGLRRFPNPAPIDRDRRFPQDWRPHAERGPSAEQRAGVVPPPHRRSLRDVLPDRRREPLPHVLGYHPLLGDRRVAASTRSKPGSSCRSAIAARRWKRRRAGCS